MDGGTVYGTDNYDYDEQYSLPVISKKGYHFDGWFTQTTDGKQVTDEDSCNQSTIQGLDECEGELTLYAHWSVCAVNISYNLNYGSSDPTVVTVDYDKLNTHTIPTPTRPGYTFDGWITSSNVPVGDLTTLEANIQPASSGNIPCPYSIELTAQWSAREYTLTFHANKPTTAGDVEYSTECFSPNGFVDGQFTQNRTYTDESEITVFASNCIEEMTLTGYDFLGWYSVKTVTQPSDTAGKRMYYDSTITAGNQINQIKFPASGNGSIDLYAHWKAKTYNIVLHAGTGAQFASGVGDTTVVATYDATYGSITGWENNFGVKKPEHTVIGWFTSDGDQKTGGMPFNGDEVNVTELFARWATAAKIHSNGGTLEAECCDAITPVVEGELYTIPVEEEKLVNKNLSLCGDDLSCITKTGYNLVGWYWESDFQTEVEFDQNYIPDGEFYADWTPRPVYVVFNENKPNGVGAAANEVTWNSPLNELANHTCTTGFYDDAHVFASDFNATDLLTLPGYTFGGFCKDQACTDKAYNTEAIDVDHFAIAKGEDIDTIYLYAKWIPDEYNLVFHANNGTDVTVEAKVAFDSAYNTAHKSNGEKGWNTQFGFTKTGYSFDGWWLDGATDSVNGQTPYTCYNCAEQHLRAHWKANNYLITYNTNKPGSTTPATLDPDTKDVTFDSPYGTLVEPECDGYTFKGWYLTKALADLAGDDSVRSTDDYTIPDDTTLFAGWKAKDDIMAHYLGNAPSGATVTPANTDILETFDSVYIQPEQDPTCLGYDFQGWYTATSGGTKITDSTNCTRTDEHNLFAHWKAHPYTVVLNANGGDFNGEETDTVEVPYLASFISVEGWNDNFGVSRNHYDFSGWFTEPNGGGIKIEGSTTYEWTKDTSLYAFWLPTTVVCTLDLNGGTINNPEECLAPAGIPGVTAGSASLTYIGNNKYTFKAVYGSTITAVLGCSLNDKVFNEGYDLTWRVEAKKSQTTNTSINVDETTWTKTDLSYSYTLKAMWSNRTIVIKLDPQGGTLTSPNNTPDSSYTVGKYWYGYLKEKKDNDFSPNEYTYDTVRNVYGKWADEPEQYASSTGAGYHRYKYRPLNTNYLKDPTRTGYFFKGWFTSKNYATGDSVGNDTVLKKDYSHTIYAKWQPQVNHIYVKNCQVATYFPNTGECGAAYSWNNDPYFDIVYDSLMQSTAGWNCLSEIKRTGYRIDGWYWDENLNSQNLVTGTTQWNVANCPNESTNGNGVFYAHIWPDWQANDYTVTLHSNGGYFNTDDTVFTVFFDQQYGNKLNSTAEQAPERIGYIFRGWFDNMQGSGDEYTYDTYCTTDSNHTLYARWEPKITAKFEQDSATCHGFNNGSLTVKMTGGEGKFNVHIEKETVHYDSIVVRSTVGDTTIVKFEGLTGGVWSIKIYDTIHPKDIDTVTGKDLCQSLDYEFEVKEPALLAFDSTRADSMGCYSKGKVYARITGGTQPYVFTWIGSSGNPDQQGSRPLSGSDTLIKQFTSQDVYLSVTDAHNCPAEKDTVHVYEAGNDLADTIRPISVNVCSAQEFEVSPVVFKKNGLEVPSGTRYSWEAPDGLADFHTGDRETTIHDSIHNNTTTSKLYSYEVTPFLGNYCQGPTFVVTVNVAPGTGDDTTRVTSIVANPESNCGGESITLTATFNHEVHNVTYRLVGYNMEGNMTSNNNANTSYTKTFNLPEICEDSITCIVSATDQSSCKVQGKDTLVVKIPEWTITAAAGSGTVTCLSDAVRPDDKLPELVTDGCGNKIDNVNFEYKEFKTDSTAWSKTDSFSCAGQVRYTYRYSACNHTSDTWTYTYTVTGMSANDTIVVDNRFANYPTTSRDTIADVDTNRCIFQVPNLKSVFLNSIDRTSTCSAPEDITFNQTPAAGEFLTSTTNVQVTLIDGCQRQSRYTVRVTVPTRPTIKPIAHGNILCYDDTTSATVTVNPGMGTPKYDYLWSDVNAQTTATAKGLKAGDYTVTVTDANGCNAYGFVSITQPTQIQFTIMALTEAGTVADSVCYGDKVVLTASPNGGTYPYTYHWTPNIGSGQVTPSQILTKDTNIYTLQIEDANHCPSEIKKDTVLVKALPQVVITPADTHICAGDSVILKAVSYESLTYSWGSNTKTVKPDSVVGVYPYSVTVTQTTGLKCVNTASTNVSVYTFPTTTIMNHPAVIAVNDSAVVGVRPLENGESVTWTIERNVENTGGNASILTPNVTEGESCEVTNIKIQANAIGTILVSATITQDNNPTGCNQITVTDTVKIRQSVIHLECPEPAQDSIIYDGLAHHIETTPLVINNAGDTITGCTFTYSVNGGSFSPDFPERILAGTTQVTVRASHDQYEPNTCTYSLTVNRRPVTVEVTDCAPWTGLRDTISMVMGDNTQYAEGSLQLVGNHVLSGMVISSTAAGGVYTYSDTADVNTASKSGVIVMNGDVPMTDNYDIKVNAVQTIMEMQVTSVKGVTCNDKSNGEITVTTLPANDTYIYYIGNNRRDDVHIVSTGVTYDNLAAGTYSVYATSADGSCQTNEVKNVTVNDIDPITVSPADTAIDICAGAAVALSASANGGSMVYTYEWRDTRKDSVVGTTATVLNVMTADTTVYTLTVRDYSDAECFTTANCTVNVRPGFPTKITAEEERVCMNSTLVLSETLNAEDANCTYQWSLGDNEDGAIVGSATNSTVSARWASAGLKHVIVNVTNDSTGCVSTGIYEVTVDTLPVVTITSDRWNICPGQDSTVLAATVGENMQYIWNAEGNPVTSSIKVGLDGTYTVTVTDGNGCVSTAAATVGRYPLPSVQLNGGNTTLSICPGQETATLTATPVEEFTYIWMRGNVIIQGGDPRVTQLQELSTVGSYRVKVIDSVGCYAFSNTVTLSHNPIPVVEVNNPTICESGVAMLTANGAETYTWSPITYLTSINNAYAEFSGAVAGTYTDTVRGVNGLGCWDTAIAHITVLPDVVLMVNDEHLLSQKVCAGTTLDSIKLHVENGTLHIQGNLPRYVVFHGDAGLGIGNDTIEGVTDQVGTFNYTLVAESNQSPKCPSKQLEGVIKVNPIPVLTLTPATQEVCAGGDIDTIMITCTNGILPETLATQGLTYNRISDVEAKVFGTVTDESLTIPVKVSSDQTDPTCEPVVENITVTVHPNPEVKIAHIDDVCPAAGTQAVTANVTVPTTGAYTYYWTGDVWIDPMLTTTESTANEVMANVPTVCKDSFELRVELTDVYGCRSVDSTMMVVRDTTAPKITALSNPMMAKPNGNCKYEIPNLRDSVTVTDACRIGEFIFGQDVAAGTWMDANTQTQDVKVWVIGGCGHTDTTVVTIRKPEPVTVYITAADSVCKGSGTPMTAVATSGNYGNITYTWTPNTGLSAANTAEVVASPLTNTTYTVTARDGNGCFAQASTTLYVYPLPVVTITEVPVLCPNAGQTTVNAQVDKGEGRGTSFIYHWTCEALNFEATDVNGEENQQIITDIPNTCNSEYTLNLEVTENGLGCVATASTVITVKDVVSPTITPDFASAWGVTTGGAGCVYTIPDLTDSSYIYTDACSQTWDTLKQSVPVGTEIAESTPVTVTAIDACGNTAETVVWVNVVNAFEIDPDAITITDVSCFGGHDGVVSIYVQDQSSYTYKIDDRDYGQTPVFNELMAGVHYVTVKNSSGCTSTFPVTVGEPDTFKMTLSTTPATCANNDGTVTMVVEGGTPNTSGKFGFDFTGTLEYTSNDTIFDQYSVSPAITQNLPVGQYTVIVEDRKGCTITETFEITLNNNLVIDEIPIPKPTCSGGSFATIPVTSTPGTTYYTWPLPEQSVENGVSGTTAATLEDEQTTVNGHNLVNNTNEPVYLTYHVTAYNGVCTYTSDLVMTVTATVRPPVVITPMDTIVCPSALDGFQLTATVSNIFFAEHDTLTWNFNNEQMIVQHHDNPSTSFTEHVAVNISASECNRIYPFTVEYTDGTCYSSEDGTVTVTIPNQFTVVAPERTDTVVSCKEDVIEPHLVPSKWPSSIIDGCGQVIDTYSDVDYPWLPDICNGDVPFVYTFKDCSGNTFTYTYTYHIVRSAMTLPAEGAATVTCESDAEKPDSPGNQPDACGKSVAPVYPDSTATNPNPVHNVVDGSGTVTYTYTYTTCDGQVYPWHFVYTVVPDPFIPFDNVEVNLHCKSEMANNDNPVPVPDTTICGKHIDFMLNANYPQDAFNGECGSRTYRYDYRVNGENYEWYYIEQIEPLDFDMPANQQRVVACYSEINIGNIPLPTVTNACGSVLQPVSMTPVVTPEESKWHKCVDTVRCTYTYEDCVGHSHEWVYSWVVKDTLAPLFVSLPEVVPAHRDIANGNCVYTYPSLGEIDVIAFAACDWNNAQSAQIVYSQDPDPLYEFDYIEQTEEVQYLPMSITAESGCHVSATDTVYVEVPAKLRLQEVLSDHKNVKCFGGSNGEIRVTATGGTPVYNYSISEPTATQTQSGYFTGLPVPADSTYGVSDSTQLVYLVTNGTNYTVNVPNGIWYGHDVVTVTDGHGCNVSDTVVISSPVKLEWENCPDTVVFCADPGKDYHTLMLGDEFVPPIPSTTVNARFSRTNFMTTYNVGKPKDFSYIARNTCGENVTCKFYFYVLPNATVKDSADNMVQEVCPNADIDPIVFTFANADSIVLSGALPESMVTYNTTQTSAYATETTVTISGNPNVTTSAVYDYLFTAYSQAKPGTNIPCSEVSYGGVITIHDTVAPTFTKPADTEVYVNAQCLADTTAATTGMLMLTDVEDNCADQFTITHRDEIEAGDCAGSYIVHRVWRVVDPSGNVAKSDSIQTITVLDTVRPVITPGYRDVFAAIPNTNCNSDVPNVCDSILKYASDNCGGNLRAVQQPAAGEEILDDIEVTVTVYDECDNSTSVKVNVTASGLVAIIIDSVDAGCYHEQNDGSVYFALEGTEVAYSTLFDNVNMGSVTVGPHIYDSLSYGQHTFTVFAQMPNSTQYCQATKAFTITPIAEMLTVTANSSEWEYDTEEHENRSFTVKFGDVVINDSVASGATATLPNGDQVTAVVTGAITDAGTVVNTLSDVVVLRGMDTVTCKYNQTLNNGTLTVTPAEITVTITGHNLTADYDATEHTVSGYEVDITDAFYTEAHFTFAGDSALARTLAGSDSMHLASDQFTSTWPTPNNIGSVNFVVAADGYLTINKINATVNIAGHNDIVDYDGELHQVNGYETTFSTPLYTRADFSFDGDSLLTLTNAGTVNMNLAPAQFANTNNNFDTVTFIVNADGYLTINPIDVTVTVVGHTSTVDYDGEQHEITGYDLAFSTDLYSASAFTFNGDSAAVRTDAGTTMMGLADTMFRNTNANFDEVTFNVTDGWMKVEPIDVTVTVTGHTNTVDYDGEEHVITGYDLAFSTPLYTSADFDFTGDSTAARTDAGVTEMVLHSDDFENTNANFDEVTFNVTNGSMTINKINATVTITGHHNEVDYDGEQHVVSGYETQFSTPLYTRGDFAFNGDSTLTLTNVDTIYMHLDPAQFSNTNTTNFNQVTFNVAADGYLMVDPIDVTVTIVGANNTAAYDGNAHHVSGYTATASTDLYDVDHDFIFSGNAYAERTHYVEGADNDGKSDMGLASDQFMNTNHNFAEVTFNVTDGYQKINKINAEVTITGHHHSDMYNGQEFSVSGFDTAYSTNLYTGTDFTFTHADNAVLINGVISAKRTDVGTTNMGLAAEQFANTNTDFDTVTFVVNDGYQTVEPNVAVVTITGHTRTVDYNGTEQQVTGYDVESNNTLYSAADFTFSGDSIAKRIHAGTTAMGLMDTMFHNMNGNFAQVTFHVADGSITVNPIDVEVAVTGNTASHTYDGMAHTVTGYSATTNSELYDVEHDFWFSGDSTATRTNVVEGTDADGKTDMGLVDTMFHNTNNDFATVTFLVTDGYQTIMPVDDVVVTVTGNHATNVYDGMAHTVTGYRATANNELYDVNHDFWFSGDSTATRTNVMEGVDADGKTDMGLVDTMFHNMNPNFVTVTFAVTDGYQTITPVDDVVVTIAGRTATNAYDAVAHNVSGYDVVEISNTLYTTSDFEFNGTAAASRTHVVEGEDVDGKTDMGIHSNDFANTSANFTNVTFQVTDGYQKITPINATVTITGHHHSDMFTGDEYSVSGFDTAYSTDLYTGNYFTFTPAANAVLINGVISAKRTDVGTTNMGLAANQFVNHSTDFDTVTFVVNDGYQTVEPNSAVVTITGHTLTVPFNGAEQQVTGYDVQSTNTLYNTADFKFTGSDTAKRTYVGTTQMVLTEDMFQNINPNFAGNVTFEVTNGAITIQPVDAEVTIVGKHDTADYNGAAHTVTGYTATATPTFYNVASGFTFTGSNSATRTDAGTTFMGLPEGQFLNVDTNFANVNFHVTDGYQTIMPIDVTVTVVGNQASNAYDGQEHTSNGFTATASTNLYKVTGDNVDFTFSGNATAARMNVDTTWMGLTAGQFSNHNDNFDTVTFNVTDGYQAITPINATVTILGNTGSNAYNAQIHTINGYTATASTNLYKVTGNNVDFTFNGTATASRTNVVEGDDETGKTFMGITEDDFTNTNPNFATVTFHVTDGYQQINPAAVTVNIKGHTDSVFYLDGVEQQVSGYDVVSITNSLYTENDFSYVGGVNDTIAKRTSVGVTTMGLAAEHFSNKSTDYHKNFNPTFSVTDGSLTVLSRHVTVTIVGNADTVVYDGESHTVTGYTVSIDQPLYTESDFTFTKNVGLSIDSVTTGENAGTYVMGLTPDQFTNNNPNYLEVDFVIARDGFVTITPKPITVTVTGHKDTAAYTGAAHTVTGYEMANTETLYDLASVQFNGTVNDSTATRTDAGTTYMGLAASQFVNTDNNFNVTFAIVDGYQNVKKDTVVVTVKGEQDIMRIYNGAEQTISGYTMNSSDPNYNPYAYVTFNGTDTAYGTDIGNYYMGLTEDMFSNTNVNYHVSFTVLDGYMRIVPKQVNVSVVGNKGYFTYDGSTTHAVHGYTVTADDDAFDVSCISYVGGENDTVASRKEEGVAYMNLDDNFSYVNCQNSNYFVNLSVQNGWVSVISADSVVVSITGHRDTVMYDGQPHVVSGYDWVATNPDYTANDFTFDGDSIITATAAGAYYGGYTAGNFHPDANSAYQHVGFQLLNAGALRIKSIDTMVVTITGNISSKTYNGAERTVMGYTATANTDMFDRSKIVFTGDSTASRMSAGTTYMGLIASQFRYDDQNFSNVIFNVQDGYMNVTKKALQVRSYNDTVFHKVYDGTPLVVSYDQLQYIGLVGTDALTQGEITTESAAVGTYVCGVGQMWSYADDENGVANASGFGEPSVTQNYAVAFNLMLRIDPVNELTAPDTVRIVLTEGTADTTVTNNVIGTPDNELVDNGSATVGNDLPDLNPLPADTNKVTWTIYDTAGHPMATTQQVVIVVYAPCDTIEYNGYDYPAKRIGYQCWMTENLRTETYDDGNVVADYHAYMDNPANLEKFGYLYTWYSAVRVAENDNDAEPEILTAANGTSYIQGVCPEGWAVASVADYGVLYQHVGDVILLKDAGEGYWYPGSGGVLPNSGFNSRAGGFYNAANSRYEDILTGDHYWKSDSTAGTVNAATGFINYFCDAPADGQSPKTDRKSVRCIKKW